MIGPGTIDCDIHPSVPNLKASMADRMPGGKTGGPFDAHLTNLGASAPALSL